MARDEHAVALSTNGERLEAWGERALLVAVTVGLVGGVVLWFAGLWFAGLRGVANALWATVTVIALVPAAVSLVRRLWQRHFGVDVIAVLALVTALIAAEYLAGAIIALMISTGQTLEAYAQRRATRDLHALVAHAPRTARRRTAQDGIEVIPLDAVRPGDRLLVAPGEVVAVDGYVEEPALLDESVVTGESQLVNRVPGGQVASGVTNAGAAFGMRAARTAADSTYAGIVRLAEQAIERKAPMVRLADRYAAAFVPFTLALAGASWLGSGHFVRAVAVLVVATPCPLLLAIPIAIVAGLSRTARIGVLVRDGGSLEVLGRASTLLVDKTGTLTMGRPTATELVAAPGVHGDEILRLAASVEQLSAHVLAAAIVDEASRRGLSLTTPTEVHEVPGVGVVGRVNGHTVRVGQLAAEPTAWAAHIPHQAELDGSTVAWISVDDSPVGALLLTDPVRPDARQTVCRLRRAGFHRLVMLTGDRPQVAAKVAKAVGADDVVARCTPQDKVDRVNAESARSVTVMVGDGVNDAPALAAAHVGVAMGATGATASAEVADAVLTVDRLDRLADTVEISRYARGIALQSATAGMALALVAMGFAAVGFVPPVAGALLQEGIDVVVTLNALRALRGGIRESR